MYWFCKCGNITHKPICDKCGNIHQDFIKITAHNLGSEIIIHKSLIDFNGYGYIRNLIKDKIILRDAGKTLTIFVLGPLINNEELLRRLYITVDEVKKYVAMYDDSLINELFRYRELDANPPKFETLLSKENINRSLKLHLLLNLLFEYRRRNLIAFIDNEVESAIEDIVNSVCRQDKSKIDIEKLVKDQKSIPKVKQVINELVRKYCKIKNLDYNDVLQYLQKNICYRDPKLDIVVKFHELFKWIITQYRLNSIIKCVEILRYVLCEDVFTKIENLFERQYPVQGYRHILVQAFLVHDVNEARKFISTKICRRLFSENDRIIVFKRDEFQLSDKFQFIDVVWLILNYYRLHATLVIFEIKTTPTSLDILKKQIKRYVEDIMNTGNRKELVGIVQKILNRKIGKNIQFECHRYEVILIIDISQENIEKIRQEITQNLTIEFGKQVHISIIDFKSIWNKVLDRIKKLEILPHLQCGGFDR